MSKYSLKKHFLKENQANNYISNKIDDELGNIDLLLNELKNQLSIIFYNKKAQINIPSKGEYFEGIKRTIEFDSLLKLLFLAKSSSILNLKNILSSINDDYATRSLNINTNQYFVNQDRGIQAAGFMAKGNLLKESIESKPLDEKYLQNIESNVINANNFSDFYEYFCVYMIASCMLHKKKHIEKESRKNLAFVLTREKFINDFIKSFTINLNLITKNPAFNIFFTNQGTAIGCLFEDIFSKKYNNDSKLETKINTKKKLALVFCQILLDEFNDSQFNFNGSIDQIDENDDSGIVFTGSYETSFNSFFKNNIVGLDKIDSFKKNMESINDIPFSKIYDIDKKLGISNASFDFIVAGEIYENSNDIAIFDLKSSHTKSSGGRSANIPTGSNLKNVATNELIILSNIDESDVIGNEHNSIKDSRYKNIEKQNKNIKSISLVKAIWKIDNAGFQIAGIKITSSSLNSATQNNVSHRADKFQINKDKFSNIDMSQKVDFNVIKNFKDFLDTEPNTITKGQKVKEGTLTILNSNLSNFIDFNQVNNKIKTSLDFNEFAEVLHRYFITSQNDIRTNITNENTEQLLPENFRDSVKIEFAIEYLEKFIKSGQEYESRADSYFTSGLPNTNKARSVRAKLAYALRDINNNHSNSNLEAVKDKINSDLNKSSKYYNGEANQNDWTFILNKLKSALEEAKQEESAFENIVDSYRPKGKFLKEVYSHLFKTKINEGMFHMMHPYEYHSSNEFKLGDILKIIDEIPLKDEDGKDKEGLKASEKLDGQNLWFSFRNEMPVFAYNMKELQAGGVPWEVLQVPYMIKDKKDIPKEFSTLERIIRLHVEKEMEDGKVEIVPWHGGYKSFKDGVEVLHQCLINAYKNHKDKVKSIFEDGNNFSSSEVIHVEGPNQILYGENFISPHFVMDKSGNRYPDKYKDLFTVLKTNEDSEFKILTRNQRNNISSQIKPFSDDQKKEYEERIISLIENTDLTLDSTIKDFHRYYLVKHIKSKGQQKLLEVENLIDYLLLFIHGSTLEASGLKNVSNYRNILTNLELNNLEGRKKFKSSYTDDITDIFFDFGIDINRDLKTTASYDEDQSENHERIVKTNLNNIKKALVIAKKIREVVNELKASGEENKNLFSLEKKLQKQIKKIKRAVERIKARENLTTNEEALEYIVSSSIEGLVLNRPVPDSDDVMELKLTGFFAPMNQVLNAIRFEVGNIDLLDGQLNKDGKIFDLNNQDTSSTYEIEDVFERKIISKFSLLEMYNLKTYPEVKTNEFDIGFVPMSAKPFTIGHEDLVKTACSKSKKVYVVISITSRFRSHENPITGKSMERLYTEDNPSGFVRDLETLLNQKIPECKGKVKVIYSKNPQNEILEILDKEFSDLYLEKNNQYAIFVGDKEDASRYKPELLGHMGDRLNVVYREEGEERLSSGTKTRSSLNTGRYTLSQEVPVKARPGKTRTLKSTYLQQPYEEDSVEYQRSFEEFAANLSNIYSPLEKKRIYDYLSQSSKDTIYNTLDSLEGIDSNKEVKEKLSAEKRNIIKALGGITSAKKLKDVYRDL